MENLTLGKKVLEHDKRRCKYFSKNPELAAKLKPNDDRGRVLIFNCSNPQLPELTSMLKCKICRDKGRGFELKES